MPAINQVTRTGRFDLQARSSLFEETTMIVVKGLTKRLKNRLFKFAVLFLFVCVTPARLFAQTESIEFRVEKNIQSRIAEKIDEISRAGEEPASVTSYREAQGNWICARAALMRTKAAIEWQDISAGVTATGFAAAKAGKEILEYYGVGKVPGLAIDILMAYAQSETLEEFTQKFEEIALKKGLGKLLEKTGKLTDVDRNLIKKLAGRIWNAFGGLKKSPNNLNYWDDPLCRDKTTTDFWIATEGIAEVAHPEPEKLVQKNCERRCADFRDKWLEARSASIASAREARTQESDLTQARRDLEIAQKALDAARKRLEAANNKVKFWEDAAAKANAEVATIGGQSYKDSRVAQSQAREEISKWESEVSRLSQEVARVTKSTPEARALADKNLKAAKAAEDAYRRCLKNCYDEASKSASPSDKEEAQKLSDPLTMPVEELLVGYVPPTTPESESPTKKARKQILHFETHGNCNCRFPESAAAKERLGKFDVVGIGELIPQEPMLEGKTIVINYKLGAVKFDVVASCGCPAAAKSETAIPKETRTENQSAKPKSQPEQKSETASYYLPSGMLTFNPDTAPAWWSSPFAPLGDCPCYHCCCNYGVPIYSNANRPGFVSVRLSQAMDRLGIGRSIHVSYGKGGYVAETYLQWAASGGSGLTVDLEVQRPQSNTFEKLATSRGPDDVLFFETRIPGAYLFRATAKDSSGKSSFNTLSVTFPFIDIESQPKPKDDSSAREIIEERIRMDRQRERY
jgi:hypothetical protein